MEDVSTAVGNKVSLLRQETVGRVRTCLQQHRLCLAAGDSGSGKSAIAVIIADREYDRVLWPPASAIESGRRNELEQALGLEHPLLDILRASPEPCLMVFDNAESYSDASMRLVARTIAEMRSDDHCNHVHILVLSQVQPLTRLTIELRRAGVSPEALESTSIDYPSDEDIGVVVSGIPELSWATARRDLLAVASELESVGSCGEGGRRRAALPNGESHQPAYSD